MARLAVIMPIVAGVLVAGVVAAVVIRAQRRAQRQREQKIPELNQHPERLDQMLDPTDDA